jgi:hypothetical protein
MKSENIIEFARTQSKLTLMSFLEPLRVNNR